MNAIQALSQLSYIPKCATARIIRNPQPKCQALNQDHNMNIAALILSIIGAGLSLFQPVVTIPVVNVGINLFSFLSCPGLDFGDRLFGFFVLITAVAGVLCGVNVLMGKNTEASAGGLVICSIIWVVLFLLSLLFAPVTHWVYIFWALCYFAAAACASQ